MTHLLTLNCLVLGQDSNCTFQVTLAPSQIIQDLQKRIKQKWKPAFDHVSADSIVLWQVPGPIHVDDKLEQNLKSLTFDTEKSLSPIKKLGDVFVPDDKYLQVVVQPAIFELNCWVLGDPSKNCIFPVQIGANDSVGWLKKAIKEKNQVEFQHVDAPSLFLWKDSVDFHGLPEKPSDVDFPNKKSLSPVDILSKVFPGVPKEGHLHIIVKSPGIGNNTTGNEAMDKVTELLEYTRYLNVTSRGMSPSQPSHV